MRPPITERAARRRAPEPIALVGAGCRFAGGAHGLPGLWRLLSEGADVVGTVPPDRWDVEAIFDPDPRKRGTLYSRWGSFLDDVGGFDPAFFGIAPREAHEMDPQQRLLLEVAWEALEDAGQPPDALTGTATGVYTGVLGMDYTVLHARQAGLEEINPWYASGREFSFGPGRLSHLLGLQGPSLSVNTACSSSLVAVHLACQALRAGEADLALAGGVNLILSPELSVFLCKVRAMSRDGRCKPFDAAADGIVRGEGCALVVLKRLADALADGDDVLAVIRSSAVNHDGASAGLTVPSGAAQQELLRGAVASAGVEADSVDYVEAHGTGTPLGDPIEMSALRAVYGAGRPEDRPLAVGSMKSNLGHTDSAAGIAGLLKAALVLRHGQVPPTLHLNERSPRIRWDWPVTVPTQLSPLPENLQRPWRAGVSAFGLSGTNAHVLLEAPPARERAAGRETGTGPVLLPLSARSAGALTDLARAHHARLSSGPADQPSLGDLAHSAGVRRTHYAEHRLAVTASDPEGLADRLAAFLDGGSAPGVSTGHHEDDGEVSAPEVVFCFSGQGSQWPGMARELLGDAPEWRVFRDSFEACDALVRDLAGWSPREEIERPEETSRLSRTEFAQPTNFAVQVALAALWRSWGVEPAAVVGHSMGEIATAYVSGALSLPTAARVAVLRGRVLADSAGRGRMATVALSEAETRTALEPFADRLWVAGVNSARSTVVSGDAEALAELTALLTAREVDCRAIPGDYPFHSPLVAGPRAELAGLLADLRPDVPTIPVVTTTPGAADGTLFDAAHWARNVTEPVRFADAVNTLLERGHTAFLEVGPHPVLALPLRHVAEERGSAEVLVTASLRRRFDAAETLLNGLGALYAHGVAVHWTQVPCRGGGRTKLPSYPWQRSRFWLRAADRPAHEGTPDAAGLPAPAVPTAAPAAPAAAMVPAEPAAAVTVPAAPEEVEWEDIVGEAVAGILGLEPGAVRRRQGFAEMGMDSVSAIELRDVLQTRVGPLRATVPFDHPTVERLAEYLRVRHSPSPRPGTPRPERPDAPAAAAEPAGETRVAGSVFGGGSPRGSAEEPIAVVGVGCRFPGGGDGPEGYWTMLSEGTDAVRLSPEGRFADRSRWQGAWLTGVDQFDADFFRITPREARVMDPQQRLFLEVAWEALEHAGQSPDRLTGTRTGVFVGMNSHDYADLITSAPDTVDAFYGTGNSFCSTSGRLSYFLGLHGPSLAVDTACSSSLVAVHLAVRSIRSGESEVALAGGVNVILGPTIHRASEIAGALAADGRCKTFDAAADGYNRGEGCGVVVLKPLSRALADGDRVLATLLGSAVNQDGPSSGLTVPHGPAQEELIRTALADARVTSADLGYVEAHGTGTPLGDPIELEALGAALADGLPAGQRVPVGSVKTNISHLEAASGIAGLIKTVLVLWHRRIPPHLHFQRPSPEIPWDELPFDVPTETVPWTEGRGAAGVSAFGFSGTNAHVVLGLAEAAPEAERAAEGDLAAPAASPDDESTEPVERPYLLTLSAADPTALAAQAGNYRELLHTGPTAAGSKDPVRDLCQTAATRRAHLAHRLTVVGRTRAELADRLGEFVEEGAEAKGLNTGHVRDAGERRIAFVYSGHGSQWKGMACRLLREDPVFRELLTEADDWLTPVLGWSVREHLAAGAELPTGPRQQELIFAVQTALTRRWHALGIRPSAVAGHSLGEVAAAHTAGILTDGDAARVLHARATTQERLVGTGAMGVVGLPAERAEEAIAGYPDRLWVALANSSRSTVLAGDPEALDEVMARLKSQRVFCRRVDAAGAGHCPLVEPFDRELAGQLAGVTPAPGGVPYYSSVVGGRQRGEVCDGAYWGRTLRDRVRFAETVRALVADGIDTFVEISPHPVLLPFIEQELGALRTEGLLLPSLRRDSDDFAVLLSSLGALHANGHPLDWSQLYPVPGPPSAAPRYPWRHRGYWLPEPPTPDRTSRGTAGTAALDGHPLLARRTAVPGGPSVFEGDLDDRSPAGAPPSGRLWDSRLLPGATWLEMALSAAREHFGPGPVELSEVELPAPFLYDAAPDGSAPDDAESEDAEAEDAAGSGRPTATAPASAATRLVLGPAAEPDGPATFAVTTRSVGDTDDTVRAGGLVSPRATVPEPAGEPHPGAEPTGEPEWVATALRAGGVSLDGIQVLGASREEGSCTVTCLREPATADWALPPDLLEVALRTPALAAGAEDGAPYLPTAVDRLTLLRAVPEGPVTVHAAVRGEAGGDRLCGDVTVRGADGAVVALLTGVALEARRTAPLPSGERARLDGLLYRQHWRYAPQKREPAPAAAPDRPDNPWWLVLADDGGVADALIRRLDAAGTTSIRVGRAQAADSDGLEKLVRDALRHPGCQGAVQMWALDLPAQADVLTDATDGGAATEAVYDTVFRLARALGSGRTALPVWHVTRGAWAPDTPAAGPRPVAATHTPVWSLASVAAMEHPAAWGGLLDLDPVSRGPEADAAVVAEELAATDDEDHVAVRAGRRLVQRVVRDRTRGPALPSVRWVRRDGAYLVAEGAGRHGVGLARRLLERGAARVVLTHGTGAAPEPEVEREVAELRATGLGELLVVEADSTDSGSLGRALDVAGDGAVLRGVFWLAVDWNLIESDAFGVPEIRRAVSERALGAWRLDALLRDRELDARLDHFTVFSGIAASWGSLGAARQAVPDAQLAALAQRRRERGRPGLCVRWAPWDGTGLLARDSETRLTRAGLRPLPLETALTALEYALTSNSPEASVCEVDWGLMMPLYQQTAWPLFDDLETGDEEGEAATALLRELTSLEPEERTAVLLERVLAEAAVVLGVDSGDELDPRRGFFDLGMNSITALELKVRLQRLCATTLPNTLVFEYPNAEAVTDYLAVDVLGLDPGTGPGPESGDAAEALDADPSRGDPAEDLLGEAGESAPPDPDEDLEARFAREMAEVEALDLGPGRWAPPHTQTHDPGEGER